MNAADRYAIEARNAEEREDALPKSKWWGYVHVNGRIQAKHYTARYGFESMQDARESPFVAAVYGPFEVAGRTEALAEVKRRHQLEPDENPFF